jgi:hypothetical protein
MLYLHIGRHKTGTTAIQTFLNANRGVLRDLGFLYPVPQAHTYAHHDVVFALDHQHTGRRPVTPSEDIGIADLSLFRQSLDHAPNVIVSSEGFQNLDPHWVSAVFPPGETTIVVYLREQLDYLLSSYAEQIQSAAIVDTFEDYACSWHVDYEAFLAKWADVFGIEHIRPRVYDREQLTGKDVIRDFLEAIGVPRSDRFASISTGSNVSLTYLLILLKTLLNRLISNDDQKAWHLYGTFGYLASIDISRPRRYPVDPSFATSFRSQHRPANARVSNRYFGSAGDVFPYLDLGDSGSFTPTEVRRVLEEFARAAPRAVSLLTSAVRDRTFVASLPSDERRLALDIRNHLPTQSSAD